MRVLLISTYELGRQPFGLASPAAWLRASGHEVTCADLSRESLPAGEAAAADVVAFFLPMHTATRLAARLIPKVRADNPSARLCCYGLYAPINEALLRSLGVEAVIGGEFEQALVDWVERRSACASLVCLDRLRFRVPDRTGLPPLGSYAHLAIGGERRVVGYTEASRGCKHLCRHCPVTPVYNGAFRVVPRDVVLEDVRRQAAAGARHITFGDPDFFNGPRHAAELVEAVHRDFPGLTYDVTIKVEHLLKHRDLLPLLRRTGCLFVTSAVESVDDRILEKLEKGHTRADFIKAVDLMRAAGLELAPTFVPFTPWTDRAGYHDLLRAVLELDLVDHVAPIQLGIRLLITAGSKLLDLPEIRDGVGAFDEKALVYPWKHALDALSRGIQALVRRSAACSRGEVFARICELAEFPAPPPRVARAAIPYLTEPWYC